VIADSVIRPYSPEVDLDGEARETAERGRTQAPAPVDGPSHGSEEPTLVEEFAEPGAENGAGAEVHVAEPWAGYQLMKTEDVIDRITGAPVADLAAVELYELSGRRRQTVLDAVQRERSRSERSG
jgi:hypothetical protein